jgi:hypothetical protein
MKKKAKKVYRPQKRTLIKKIQAIIREWGGFSTADVEATSSPVIKTLGKDTCQLAERFELYKVEAVIYVHDNETDTDYIAYKDLDRDTLEEILYLAENWEAECLQDEDRQGKNQL